MERLDWLFNFFDLDSLLKVKGWNKMVFSEKEWLLKQSKSINSLTLNEIERLDTLNPLLGYDWKLDVKEQIWKKKYDEIHYKLKNKGYLGLDKKEKSWLQTAKVTIDKGIISKERMDLITVLYKYLNVKNRVYIFGK